MKFEVRDSGDNVIANLDFELDPNQERRITISSSSGGSTHTFQDSTPLIYCRLPSWVVTAGEVVPASSEAPEGDGVNVVEGGELPAASLFSSS